jgi:hypothetical protein
MGLRRTAVIVIVFEKRRARGLVGKTTVIVIVLNRREARGVREIGRNTVIVFVAIRETTVPIVPALRYVQIVRS